MHLAYEGRSRMANNDKPQRRHPKEPDNKMTRRSRRVRVGQPKTYDSVIVGGGPAGLSAAIYLARFNRSVLVLDRGGGRWATHEVNENYFGFPGGIPARELRDRGRKQARRFGAYMARDNATRITPEGSLFIVHGKDGAYVARTVVLATGVLDLMPRFPGYEAYLGRSLFWCITCDGWKTRGKRVVVVGRNDDAAETAMQFLNFTPQIQFVTNCPQEGCELTPTWRRRLEQAHIPIYEIEIQRVRGKRGMMQSVVLEHGEELEADYMFNQQGAVPNSALAAELGVELDEKGYIKTDTEQRTNVSGVYAAGDVTKLFAHQIVTAAHEGSMAAQAANYDLYSPVQKES